MNKQTTVSDTICRIGDETFDKLKSLSVPPYPKNYHEIFMETLHRGEDSKAIKLSKKFGYLFTMSEEQILKEASESKLFYKGNNIHLTLSSGLTSYRQGDTIMQS